MSTIKSLFLLFHFWKFSSGLLGTSSALYINVLSPVNTSEHIWCSLAYTWKRLSLKKMHSPQLNVCMGGLYQASKKKRGCGSFKVPHCLCIPRAGQRGDYLSQGWTRRGWFRWDSDPLSTPEEGEYLHPILSRQNPVSPDPLHLAFNPARPGQSLC